MQIRKFLTRVGLPAVLLVSFMSAAYADRPGFYAGGAWGAYRINEGDLDDNDDMLKAFGGVQFNSWFGVEGSWVDFNRMNSDNDNFEADGKGVAAVFTMPLSDTSSIYGKIGNYWWEADSSLGSAVGSSDGDDLFFGGGFKFAFNKLLALRLEVERYEVNNVDLDTATVGLQVNF